MYNLLIYRKWQQDMPHIESYCFMVERLVHTPTVLCRLIMFFKPCERNLLFRQILPLNRLVMRMKRKFYT